MNVPDVALCTRNSDTPVSKRDRKDAKRFAKAATRSNIVTQQEIQHVDMVIHATEYIPRTSNDDPSNSDQIDQIGQQPQHHGHVYHNHPTHKTPQASAQAPEVDYDLSSEIERIFRTFRITELVKRNEKNRGLQRKELKVFSALVENFRSRVLDDLVMVKQDELEARMRRAGYLRYTNKTAYNIVEQRYKNKDWKTGERITAASKTSNSELPLSVEMTRDSW
jgi:hypothetical protein